MKIYLQKEESMQIGKKYVHNRKKKYSHKEKKL